MQILKPEKSHISQIFILCTESDLIVFKLELAKFLVTCLVSFEKPQ